MMHRTVFPIALACFLGACGELVPPDSKGSAPIRDGSDEATDDFRDGGSKVDADQTVTSTSSSSPDSGYTVALTTQTVLRFLPNGTPYPLRPANESPNAIDAQDCEDNITLQFDVTEGGVGASSADILETWVGTADCAQPSARAGEDPPFCCQIYPAQEAATTAAVNLYARSIVSYLVESGQTRIPNDGGPVVGPGLPESVCQSLGGPLACSVPVTIYFMFLPHDGASPDAVTTYSLGVFVTPPDGGECGS